MEHKQFDEAVVTVVDEAQGIVEAVWAVMGNVDDGGDISHPGSFTKTFNERAHQVKLLDNHRASSVMDSLGVVKQLRELTRDELPQEIIDKYPEATGGAWGRFQFLMDTPEGKGAFTRIKHGAIKGWSYGYDAVDKDYGTVTRGGEEVRVRHLRQQKLYEISPVLFPMNEATATTGFKGKPTEGKPYTIVEDDGVFKVYKEDEDGNPTGDSLGEHDTEDEAEEQVRALYALEAEGDDKAKWSTAYINDLPDSAFLYIKPGGEKDDQGKTTPRDLRYFPYKDAEGNVDLPHLRNAISRAPQADLPQDVIDSVQKRARNILEKQGDDKQLSTKDEQKAGRVLSQANAKRIMDAMELLQQALKSAGLMDMEDDGPSKSETPTPPDGAGPLDERDTYLKLIEIELEEMEV